MATENIEDFRKNQVRQQALHELLQNENLQTALAIISQNIKMPAIALDAPEIVSVRASALTRGSERVLDFLYLLATPYIEPQQIPDATYGAPDDTEL